MNETKRSVTIYDRPLCCSTGVCGPQIDPVLPRFAADLQWLSARGVDVTRFNLAQDPAAFAENLLVRQVLAEEGTECLPLIIVGEAVMSRGSYPSRETLATWTEIPTIQDAESGVAGVDPLKVVTKDPGCCDGKTDCC